MTKSELDKLPAPKVVPLDKLKMSDQKWRLNNLYVIKGVDGQPIKFKMRPAQEHFYDNMWYRNIIVKSRQHGFSTLVNVIGLDNVMFIPNTSMVVIAHKTDSAKAIMNRMIVFPYLSLHPEIKERISITKQNETEIVFSNGSRVEVSTSGRSSTGQFGLISELGYTARHFPERAREIITGTIPAFHEGSYLTIESTAEGEGGAFFDLAMSAQEDKLMGRKLSPFDFKIHFYAWHDNPENRLSDEDTKNVILLPRLKEYFAKLESESNIVLSDNQKAWYAGQESILQQLIMQEHPSTIDEAFAASGEGLILKQQLYDAMIDGRLGTYKHASGHMVHTAWDLGLSANNQTAIWFIQNIGGMHRVIDYLEDTDMPLQEWIAKVRSYAHEKGYILGNWIGPHDLKKRSGNDGMSMDMAAKNMGVEFKIVEKVALKEVAIQSLRSNFSIFCIDEENCEVGVNHLRNYRYEYDSIRGVFKSKPFHGPESNAADALQQYALWLDRDALRKQKEGTARKEKSIQKFSQFGNIDISTGSVRRPKTNKLRGWF